MRTCSKCVMNDSDPDIHFDESVVCNYCREYEKARSKYIFTDEEVKYHLNKIRDEIKSRSEKSNSEYDCIIGLSGGVDSSYLCHIIKEMELNPLCLHFDNGWNSDISVSNIRNMVNECNFDLLNVVMNWPEFRDIQKSFFLAGVIDIELITDNAVYALAFKEARKRNIRSWISGSNYVTEHGMPASWNWPKQDYRNIKDIYKKFMGKKVKHLPLYGPHTYALIRGFQFGGVKFFKPLDFINYNSLETREFLTKEYGWRSYGKKHEESVFTSFYQNYVLIKKFGVDKRVVHLSAQIRNNELTREEALKELDENPLELDSVLRNKRFVLKKLNFTEDEFDEILSKNPVPHTKYKNTKFWMDFYTYFYKLLQYT